MATGKSAATTKMSPAQINQMARQNLIRTGLKFTKRLQSFSSLGSANIMGATVRIPLDRTGVVTGVTLLFQVPYTYSGSTATIASYISQFWPWNIVTNITYTDFAGVKHVNTRGWELHALNQLRGSRVIENPHEMASLISAETAIDSNILGVQSVVTSSGGVQVKTSGDLPEYGNIYFSLYVPLAYDPESDLRGAILAQTDRGEHYLNITFANALSAATGDPLTTPFIGTADVVLGNTSGSSAAGPLSSYIIVDTYQHYIMPQSGISPNNLPMIDLGTIYEILGGLTDASNVVAGSNKFVNWPNNRAIVSAMHLYDNPAADTSLGNLLNQTDMSLITLLINGNTNVKQMTPALMRLHLRYNLGVDLPSGVYYLSARRQPITTQLYGNVQTQFTINTVGTGLTSPYFDSQFESFYLSGTPLPGVIQG